MSTTDPITNKGDASLASNAEAESFDKAMRAQIKMNAEIEAIRAKNTKQRKTFKADGISLKHLDATIAMLAWSPSEVREAFSVGQRYARYAGLPIGTQIDLLADTDDEAVARADWRARGQADALRDKPASVPKGCPPEFHQEYLAGHEAARWPK